MVFWGKKEAYKHGVLGGKEAYKHDVLGEKVAMTIVKF